MGKNTLERGIESPALLIALPFVVAPHDHSRSSVARHGSIFCIAGGAFRRSLGITRFHDRRRGAKAPTANPQALKVDRRPLTNPF